MPRRSRASRSSSSSSSRSAQVAQRRIIRLGKAQMDELRAYRADPDQFYRQKVDRECEEIKRSFYQKHKRNRIFLRVRSRSQSQSSQVSDL
ncbi:hypothetical protein M406DRAFT_358589 [Cryphonectria parasitica EP155]|uniref:Uncharacterized protein n=1 Tax=Cryphonectria parasitica (strain ATCC 38755 / EP155) TaxID=660469 RepID=A0A9P4XSX4_CRYP1|nr:uncharacterized protein M406DRAFT_358589 [Cryphonectria parasitica EP155]KAF3760313.1 hypothetical protein M406DRAFT_358589 [Cryphonectria parasitica EP155]